MLSLKPNAFNKGEVLTRAQLKKVMGGDANSTEPDDSVKACEGKTEGASCTYSNKHGNCVQGPWTSLYCNIPPGG